MCGDCKVDDQSKVEIGVDVDCDSNMFQFVFGIDGIGDTEDDEFVTTNYKVCETWTAGSVATRGEAVRQVCQSEFR